jgi:putative transposase
MLELTETIIITFEHNNFKQIDKLCFQSKNLYNYANYIIRQEFIKNRKWIRYNDLEKIIRSTPIGEELFTSIPNNTSQQILMILDRNWKAFFASIKSYMKNKDKFIGRPKLPKYKHKIDGRNLLIFTYAQIGYNHKDTYIHPKNGYIHFPKKCQLQPIKTRQENIKQVRIVPFKNVYKIEIVYEKEEIKHDLDTQKWLSIDLGIDNLCTITTNVSNLKPILVNGKHIKSVNWFYNKSLANIKSTLKKVNKKDWSKRLTILNLKRHNKIEYEFHCISKFIVQYCIQNNIGNIVIGLNKGWKQEIELSKVVNQKFVYIPYQSLINQITYKAQLNGINVQTNEESYTSKCSSLDLEPIKKHETYVGKRTKRGLFRTSVGDFINADVNGSLNILRKVIGDDFINLLNIGCVQQPVKTCFFTKS